MQQISKLIDRFWSRKNRAKENKQLLESLEQDADEIQAQHRNEFEDSLTGANLEKMPEERRQRVFRNLQRHIQQQQSVSDQAFPPYHLQSKRRYAFIRVAAAAILMLALGSMIAIRQIQQGIQADATGIALSKDITKKNDSQAVLSFSMPDRSTVHLAPGAAITYTTDYNNRNRDISLTGQARFDVTKNPNLPFQVSARGYTVTALGTIFLVNANASDRMLVALLEGKVAVQKITTTAEKTEAHILLPGEELLIDLQNQQLKHFDMASSKAHKAEEYALHPELAAPKIGSQRIVLHFSDTPVLTVISQLQELYGKTFVYDQQQLSREVYSGSLSLGDGSSIDSLRKTLNILFSGSNLGFSIEADQIKIKRKETQNN